MSLDLGTEYYARLVAPAPDFTPEQLERLRQILGGPIEELGQIKSRSAA